MNGSGLRPCLAELLGTFVLVIAGGGAIAAHELRGVPDHTGVALTFGLAVAAMIYALGHLSGAHINPAVTLAFAASGRFAWRRVPGYVGAQLIGAVAAAGLLRLIVGGRSDLGTTLPSVSLLAAVLLEVVLALVLMMVITAVATDSRAIGKAAGAVIGGTVSFEALWAGPFTGASMNPARSLGPALVSGHLEHLWIYLVAPVVGALLGALLYALLVGPSRPLKDDASPPGCAGHARGQSSFRK